MREIAETAMLVFLIVGAALDIRVKQVPVGYLLVGTCAVILYQAVEGRQSWYLWILGMATGVVFLLFSKCSKESIGYGDSWMILNLGIFMGLWKILAVLGTAFLCSTVVAVTGMIAGKWDRKTRIPFYPFLVAGYLGAMIW